MPLVNWNTKADFDSQYEGPVPNEAGTSPLVTMHYHRARMFDSAIWTAERIVNAMGWTAPGPALVVLGCGFGWTVEVLEQAHGFTRVIGLDQSSYIQSAKGTDETADIDAAIVAAGRNPNSGEGLAWRNLLRARYGGDVGPRSKTTRTIGNHAGETQQARNQVKQALGLQGNEQPDFILTEDLITSYTDAEVLTDTTRLLAWVPQVVHFYTSVGPPYNTNTLAQWRALLPLPTVTLLYVNPNTGLIDIG